MKAVVVCLCLIFGVARAVAEPFGIMTYNIHHGSGTDGVFDLGRIARIVNSADPRFTGLQEGDMGTARTRIRMDIPTGRLPATARNISRFD